MNEKKYTFDEWIKRKVNFNNMVNGPHDSVEKNICEHIIRHNTSELFTRLSERNTSSKYDLLIINAISTNIKTDGDNERVNICKKILSIYRDRKVLT